MPNNFLIKESILHKRKRYRYVNVHVCVRFVITICNITFLKFEMAFVKSQWVTFKVFNILYGKCRKSAKLLYVWWRENNLGWLLTLFVQFLNFMNNSYKKSNITIAIINIAIHFHWKVFCYIMNTWVHFWWLLNCCFVS